MIIIMSVPEIYFYKYVAGYEILSVCTAICHIDLSQLHTPVALLQILANTDAYYYD